jgi:hypothetical protein
MGADVVLPLRPLTLGELLDAGIALLRRHATGLLLSGAVLAVLEQLLLYPLRAGTLHRAGIFWVPSYDTLAPAWLLLATGLGTESVIITLLAGPAAGAARDALLDERSPRRYRLAHLAPLALLLGAGSAVCATASLLPWFAWYGLTGLAAPALIVDRRVPLQAAPSGTRFTAVALARADASPRPIGLFAALGRSFALVGRGRLRPAGIRLLGYLAWYLIRLALGLGGVAAVGLFVHTGSTGWWWLITMAIWALVNAVAYPALACLDAVVHLENRMRVEGLDIALSRALRRGAPTAPVLAVPRA